MTLLHYTNSFLLGNSYVGYLIGGLIAKSSQLILLPTGISLDDLEPKVRLAHEYFPCKEVQTIQSKAIETHKQLEMSKSKGLELEL